LVPDRSGGEIKTGGIFKYSDDLIFASNKNIGPEAFLGWLVIFE
jgi:hypothetical protein